MEVEFRIELVGAGTIPPEPFAADGAKPVA